MKLLLINLFLCAAVLVNAQDTLNIDAKLQKEYRETGNITPIKREVEKIA